MYVSTLKDGIFILKNDTLEKHIVDDYMVDTKVVSITDYQNKLFVSTSLKGCFLYDGGKLRPWNTEINTIIKEHQLNSFSMLKNGNMVFGTIKNGIYVTDKFGRVIYHISKENGLMNNTILDQFVTDDEELWLGLDNGIASVNLNSPHSFYNDVTGKLGAVYDVISYKGIIYIGSNTGLYYIDKQHHLQFIEGSQGQVWELKIVKGQLFCGHNEGTFLVENDKITLVSNNTGGWVTKKVPEQNNLYIQGTYSGIARFRETNNTWDVKHLGDPTIPIRLLVFEDTHSAWIAHAYKGLYKIKFDKTYDTILEVKDYSKKGLKSDYNVRVYKLKSDICFKTNDGWQKYEPLLDSIVPFKFLNDSFSKDAYVISDEDSDILALKNKDYIEFKSFSNPNFRLSLSHRFFRNRLIVGHERISKINDSIFALNLNDGFMLINGNNHSESGSLVKPTVEKIEVANNLIEFDTSKSVEFPINNSISFFVSSAKSKNHFLEYSISNKDTINWYKLDKDKLELSNLKDGDYTISFRASDNFGHISDIESIKIKILPPWYKDTLGFALYFFIGLLVAFIFYMLHKRKIYKEQRLLQLKLKKEQREALREKAIENEKKLVEIKNQSLKNEVKLKSKQLANTAMALVKKNEALQELKKELMIHKSGFDNNFSFKKLLNKIDSSISQKDEWKVFEYNFNQVHEEFFNQLKNEFPELTHKDLKICAYIKMNLTTKEIAPLLNISSRGVETHRYRLKRKLNLENDNSLTTFLQNYK
jgi:DNA-binding CsgD family transcriptional regulator